MSRRAGTAWLVALALAGACGAKTGLHQPDVGPTLSDAGPDLAPPPPICVDVPRTVIP